MFLLHQRTRRLLCRSGFMALCVLPTSAVALWTAGRNSDWHRRQCEAALTSVLGLHAAIGRVEHPQPRVVRYTDVVVSDPQSGAPLVRGGRIEVRTGDAAITISSPRLSVDSRAANPLAELLRRRLHERVRGLPVRLLLGEVLVSSAGGEALLVDVRGRLEPTSEGQGAQIAFRTEAMTREAQQAVLTMVRSGDGHVGLEFASRGAFADAGGDFVPALRFLRTLVAAPQPPVSVNIEAQELLDVSP